MWPIVGGDRRDNRGQDRNSHSWHRGSYTPTDGDASDHSSDSNTCDVPHTVAHPYAATYSHTGHVSTCTHTSTRTNAGAYSHAATYSNTAAYPHARTSQCCGVVC